MGQGIEPGSSTFEQAGNGKVCDKKYTGILLLDERDTLAKLASSTGGTIPGYSYPS